MKEGILKLDVCLLSIAGDDANLIVNSLTKVIITTKIKVIF